MFCTNILVKSRKYRIFLCIIYKFIFFTQFKCTYAPFFPYKISRIFLTFQGNFFIIETDSAVKRNRILTEKFA